MKERSCPKFISGHSFPFYQTLQVSRPPHSSSHQLSSPDLPHKNIRTSPIIHIPQDAEITMHYQVYLAARLLFLGVLSAFLCSYIFTPTEASAVTTTTITVVEQALPTLAIPAIPLKPETPKLLTQNTGSDALNAWLNFQCPVDCHGGAACEFPHPLHCDQYINCMEGRPPIVIKCGDGLHFWDQQKQCAPPRQAKCGGGDTELKVRDVEKRALCWFMNEHSVWIMKNCGPGKVVGVSLKLTKLIA